MPHSPRLIDTDGGIYHVTTRGNNKSFVLENDHDKAAFKAIVSKYKKKTPFRLFHYSVMGNHYHLKLEPTCGSTLAEIMQRINHSYSLYFKKRYGFSGQLWQGRFHSSLIDSDAYLLRCGIYIELNPVRAKISEKPDDYPWSSYKYYALGTPDELIDPDPLYESLGGTAPERQLAYRSMTLMAMLEKKGVPASP
jgi:putative transposase